MHGPLSKQLKCARPARRWSSASSPLAMGAPRAAAARRSRAGSPPHARRNSAWRDRQPRGAARESGGFCRGPARIRWWAISRLPTPRVRVRALQMIHYAQVNALPLRRPRFLIQPLAHEWVDESIGVAVLREEARLTASSSRRTRSSAGCSATLASALRPNLGPRMRREPGRRGTPKRSRVRVGDHGCHR